MKHVSTKLCLLIIICISQSLHAHRQEVIGRSFMFTRPAYYNLAMYQHLIHAIFYGKKEPVGGAAQVIGFYQHATPQPKTARYFLIDCKNRLLVAGDSVYSDLCTRNVRAEWIGLPQDFSGFFSICPQQKQAGFLIDYNQDLRRLYDIELLDGSWLDITIPFVWVENDIQLHQFDMHNQPTSGPVRDIKTAFNQPAWHFAKMNGRMHKARPAEVKVSLGQTYQAENNFEFAYYSCLVFPSGNKPNAAYLFSPVAGNAKHVGFGGGTIMQFVLNRDPATFAWCFFANLEGIFLIRNNQCRTFDLKNKPWSRYMLYNIKGCPPDQNIPGVNIFTLDTTVHPYGMFDFSTGFRLRTSWFEWEMGYNVWGHDHETLKLRERFVSQCRPQYGIAGVGPLNPSAPPELQVASSASMSTISMLAPNDVDQAGNPIFVPITDEDIDLRSAAAGSSLNQKLHTAFGFTFIDDEVAATTGGGFYVDFPQKNSALYTWGVWLKGAASF